MTEYCLLREDDRSSPPVMVGLASVMAIVGGTSAFFLLRGCGVEATAACTSYPSQIYALIPAPTLAISALLVQQSVVATIRGRLMLAIEAELMADVSEEYRLGDGMASALATYHFQQPMNHEARGASLWMIMFILPLILLVGLIYYSGLLIQGPWQWAFYFSMPLWCSPWHGQRFRCSADTGRLIPG